MGFILTRAKPARFKLNLREQPGALLSLILDTKNLSFEEVTDSFLNPLVVQFMAEYRESTSTVHSNSSRSTESSEKDLGFSFNDNFAPVTGLSVEHVRAVSKSPHDHEYNMHTEILALFDTTNEDAAVSHMKKSFDDLSKKWSIRGPLCTWCDNSNCNNEPVSVCLKCHYSCHLNCPHSLPGYDQRSDIVKQLRHSFRCDDEIFGKLVSRNDFQPRSHVDLDSDHQPHANRTS